MRVSYNDYKLYLSILESVSKQLNRAIKSEVSLNSEDDIPDHDFDGKRDTLFIVHQFFCSEKRKTNQTQQQQNIPKRPAARVQLLCPHGISSKRSHNFCYEPMLWRSKSPRNMI